jgi:hypothetical protein
VVHHRASRWLLSTTAALAFALAPIGAGALTVCSVGVGGSGKLDTGTGGTGIDTGHGGTGVLAEIGTGGTGIDTGHGGTGVQAEIGTGGTGIDTGHGGTGVQAEIGTGGTGKQANIGTGGTGIDTGTGGTGIDTGTGGTGIVGVITGFGSICVNGIEVEFNERTPVVDNGATGRADNLKVGQVVEVLAAGKGERVMARQINVRDPLLGPVTRVDPANNRLEVMHQPVRWQAGTVGGQVGARTVRLVDVKPGQFVRVSGFRTDTGEVIASRVDPAPSGSVRLTGTVSEASSSRARIQGIAVEIASGQRVSARSEVSVTGQWQGDAIRATRVEPAAAMNFAGRADFVSVQGSIGAQLPDGSYSLGSARVKVGASTRFEGGAQSAIRRGEVLQVEGRLSASNEIEADRIYLGDRVPRPDEHGRGGGRRSNASSEPTSGSVDDADNNGGNDESGSDDDDRNSDSGGSRDDGSSGSDHDSSRDSDDRAEKQERDRVEKTEKVERDRVEKAEKAERDRAEKIEKLERDRIDKLEKIERDAAKDLERQQRDSPND